MRHIFCFLLWAVFSAGQLFAQAYSPFSMDQSKTSSLPGQLRNFVDEALVLDGNLQSFRSIVRDKSEQIKLDLPVGMHRSLNFDLRKLDILTPDAKTVSGTAAGDIPFDMRGSFVSYYGYAKEFSNALLCVSFSNEGCLGLMMTGNDSYILTKTGIKGLESNYVVYRAGDLKIKEEFLCGTEGMDIPQRIKELQRSLNNYRRDANSPTFLKANIAIESDYETYLRFGSVENTSRYLLSLMSVVSAVYIRDVNVQLTVPYLRVWTIANDPYTGNTSFELLSEFRNYWNANMQSVPRTLAHYITTRNGGLGGVAWLNVLCASLSSGFGYAFSNINGTYQPLPTYSWDVDVVAHETGHNFGSPHTHNCGWPGGPIDTCYVSQENQGCVTTAVPRVGTIMSYCHLNAGKILIFGPLPSDLIRLNAESAPCLTANANFYLAVPNGGELYRSGNSATIIWGTSITGTVNIEYSTNSGSTWATIANNVPATNRGYTWTVPYIPTSIQNKVRVYETGNQSNGDLSDSVFQIRPSIKTLSLISPAVLSRFNTSPTDTTLMHFIWSKSGSLPEFNYKWKLSNLTSTLNYERTSNNNGSDTLLSIRINTIDSLLSAWGVQMGDSLRGRWKVTVYTQLDSQSSNNFLITFIRQIVGIEPISNIVPKEFFLNQNYPNPFNPVTRIRFGLPRASSVKITVYDVIGRVVSKIADQRLAAGTFEVMWDATPYTSGVYFYRIEADGFQNTKKMLIVK